MRLSGMLTAVDVHAGGEPGRVIVGGVLDVPGASMFEKRLYLEQHADHLRKRMLREPRGYPGLCCNLILPPTHPDADAGFVIMEQTDYPPMSGSNTICVATVLLETGMLPMREPVTDIVLEAPAGLIRVRAEVANAKVKSVTFRNVPAFATHLDVPLEVPQLGTLRVDVAYGGMFYVIADAPSLGLRLTPDEGREIVRIGEMIKAASREQLPVVHPENAAIGGFSTALLSGPARGPDADMRNAVVISTGAFGWSRPDTWTGVLDRSACGTGTCARMATLWARGRLDLGQPFRHEGILGTTFVGCLIEEARVGPYKAVVPTITGTAWITGIGQYVLDAEDPFPDGFTVGDLWA
ncbi:MAG: proline racemase family protein [Chloroflexota bacterium]